MMCVQARKWDYGGPSSLVIHLLPSECSGQVLTDERLFCSRALGDADFKEGLGDGTVICAPDVRQVDLGPDDQAVILASDGVWDMVADQQAVDIVVRTIQVLSLPLPD